MVWWLFKNNKSSGFSGSSTAEEVTQGIDGTGLTAVVTGATSGIGVETARVLALRGVHVVMAVRNTVAAGDLRAEIVREIPSAKIDAMELDLSSMASVRRFASNYKSSGRPLNILINNAGVISRKFMLSKDNIELDFATNYLGHFLLTDLLLETMKKTACGSKREGRIVNVSSNAHRISYPGGIRFDKSNDPSGHNAMLSYSQSKLANVLHADELAKRLKDDGANITANSLHPGVIATNILRPKNKIVIALLKVFVAPFMKNVQQGAATTCYVALHPQVECISGAYFENCNLSEASGQARDMDLANKLWDFSKNLVNK